ncbi:MAG: hypothetical protein AAFU53_07955 [Cyanobacteria bacterium J06632_3]
MFYLGVGVALSTLVAGAGLAPLPYPAVTSPVSELLEPVLEPVVNTPNGDPLLELSQSTMQGYGEYVGMIYVGGSIDKLPGNLSTSGGWIVYDRIEDAPLDYAIANVRDEETGTNLVFFEKEIGRSVTDDGDHAVWEIIDVMNLTELASSLALTSAEGDAVIFIQPGCNYEGEYDPEIFAIVDSREESEFFPVHMAWRANRTTGEIESMATAALQCVNRGWGI